MSTEVCIHAVVEEEKSTMHVSMFDAVYTKFKQNLQEEVQKNFTIDLVPLTLLISRMPQLKQCAKNFEHDEPDMYWGFMQVLDLAQLLWNSPPPQHIHVNRWEQMKFELMFSIIKDTKCFGNTSVSMGAATTQHSFANLNCGSGGIKYQVYMDEKESIIMVHEYKPGNYTPFGKGPKFPSPNDLTDEDLNDDIMLNTYGRLLDDSIRDMWTKMGIVNQPVEFKAFVTGKLRSRWEDAKTDAEKEKLETAMRQYFGPHIDPAVGESFFITQEQEAVLEFNGTTAMHANLCSAKLIPEKVKIIATFGIGGSSTQFSTESQDITIKRGMKNRQAGQGVASHIMLKLVDMIDFWRHMACDDQNVIALKSGCSLLFSKYPELYKMLQNNGQEDAVIAKLDTLTRMSESTRRVINQLFL